HMGNAIVTDVQKPEEMISESTLNRTSLDGLFDARGYVSSHSDIVALMVFHHQSHMINLITRVGWEARVAVHDQRLVIYSAAFGALTGEVRQAIYGRMWKILSGADTSPKYARLTEGDRRAIVEIVRDTLPEAAAAFNAR